MSDSFRDSLDLSSDQEFMTQLELACHDLLWLSEAEYPLQPVYWDDVANFSEQYLLQRHNYSADTEIAIREFDDFFAAVTKSETWHNETEQQEVIRYQKLVDLLARNLGELKVYLLGETEIDVYVLGQTQQKAIAGIQTKIIRT